VKIFIEVVRIIDTQIRQKWMLHRSHGLMNTQKCWVNKVLYKKGQALVRKRWNLTSLRGTRVWEPIHITDSFNRHAAMSLLILQLSLILTQPIEMYKMYKNIREDCPYTKRATYRNNTQIQEILLKYQRIPPKKVILNTPIYILFFLATLWHTALQTALIAYIPQTLST
jgi:hypothetical protein